MDTIDRVRIFGTNIGENTPNRALVLDDMTIDGVLVPEPGTLGVGVAGLMVAVGRLRFEKNRRGRGRAKGQ